VDRPAMGQCCSGSGAPRDNVSANVQAPVVAQAPLMPPAAYIPPLKRLRPEPTPTPWSIEVLYRQREEFWDTRVEGRPEIWTVLKAAAAVMENDNNGKGAIEAACMLQANCITTPSGTLALCYDALGKEYIIPNYCLTKPSNLQTGNLADMQGNRRVCHDSLWGFPVFDRSCGQGSASSTSPTAFSTSGPITTSSKTKLQPNSAHGNALNLYVRVGADDIAVTMSKSDPVHALKSKVMEHLGPQSKGKTLRLFFYGKEMLNNFQISRCPGINNQIHNQTEIVLVGVLH